jgi:hypothetical protein
MHQKGISNIVIIVGVAVACITFSVSFFLASRSNSLEAILRDVKQRKEKIENEEKALKELYVYELSPLIANGFDESKGADLKTVQDYLDGEKKAYNLVGLDSTLENAVGRAAGILSELELQINRYNFEKESAQVRHEQLAGALTHMSGLEDQEIGKLKSVLDTLNSRAAEEEKKYEELRTQLDGRRRDLETQVPQRQREFDNKKVRLQNSIFYIKQTLEDLTKQEIVRRELIESQGQVFKPDVKNAFAFINLGQNDHLTTGIRFRVYRKGKGGVLKWKGIITVKKIFDTYSFVSITDVVNADDPITEGDYINNIFYRQPSVVLIGTFERPNFKYDCLEIERRLLRLGVKVEEKVNLKVDFVLLGKNPGGASELDDSNYKIVRKLTVPVVEEAAAREYIEYYLGD